MRRASILLLLVAVGVAALGCGDPNQKANTLYVEACGLVESGKRAEETSYARAADHYREALTRVDRIIEKYPSSELAVKLAGGEGQMCGVPLTQFRELVVPLVEYKAEAEQDVALCAFLVLKAVEPKLWSGYHDDTPKEYALHAVAGALAAWGHGRMAINLLRECDYLKSSATKDVAVGCAIGGEYDLALEALNGIKSVDDISYVMSRMALAAARRSDYEQAVDFASGIADSSKRKNTYHYIAVAQAEAGDYAIAYRAANSISDYCVAEVRTAVAIREAGLGKIEFAVAMADTLREAGNIYLAAEIVESASGEYAQRGEISRSLELARSLDWGYGRVEALLKTTAASHAAGDISRSQEILDELTAYGQSLEDGVRRALVLDRVATGYASVGDGVSASRMITDALSSASRIESDWEQETVIADVAACSIIAGDMEKAYETTADVGQPGILAMDIDEWMRRLFYYGSPADALRLAISIPEAWPLRSETVDGGYLKAMVLGRTAQEMAEEKMEIGEAEALLLHRILRTVD
ncbi:hypothetical protein ACFL2Z_00600 [Candidatus Eisenbacteria bacterium]|uniref:Tetratricopeptide repeat protein n=1 Tax=Eiseniibacteriota bacterium TaxID=2212470 RepID=A0ABV6YMU0_UNCEI